MARIRFVRHRTVDQVRQKYRSCRHPVEKVRWHTVWLPARTDEPRTPAQVARYARDRRPSRRTASSTSSRRVPPELRPVEPFWSLVREAVADDTFGKLADLRRRLADDREAVPGAIGFHWGAALG